MTSSGFRGCPWTTLGVSRTASTDEVREAYRRMALKYHPDLNKGCAEASKRFQVIKDAFEEIKARHATAGAHRPQASRHRQSASASTRYRYANTAARKATGPNFHGFRRDGRAHEEFRSGYQEGPYARRPQRSTSHETLRAFRSRLRYLERTGVGLGVLVAGGTLFAGVFGLDYAWRVKNRGKSFEDLMKTLDARPSASDKFVRRKRKSPSSAGAD